MLFWSPGKFHPRLAVLLLVGYACNRVLLRIGETKDFGLFIPPGGQSNIMWKTELKVFQGFLCFLISPAKTWRMLTTSYFVGSYLPGILVVLAFFLIAEPAILHLLIGKFLSPVWSTPLHFILLALELWAVEQILGHLYWIAHSQAKVYGQAVTLELGLIWEIRFGLASIKRLEFSHFEPLTPRIPRFALDREINLRLHFRDRMPAVRMGKTRFIEVLEVSLRECELDFFKKANELKGFTIGPTCP